MNFDLLNYAQQIIDATEQLGGTDDPAAAVAALDALNHLLEDRVALRLMASTFTLLASMFLDEPAPAISPNED